MNAVMRGSSVMGSAPRSRGFLLSLLALTATLSSCSAEAPECTAPERCADAPACDAVNGRFTLTDDTNYSLPLSIDVESYQLKDATNLSFDWGSLTRDFYGRPLDAKLDIDLVLISLWRKTPAELKDALVRDDLPPTENIGIITTYPVDSYTSQLLLDFDLTGNPVPDDEIWQYFDTKHPNFHYPESEFTFLLEASTGTALGRGARMLAFFGVDPAATATSLSLENDSAAIHYEAHLTEARPMHVPAATPGLTIDWSAMTKNALGNPYPGLEITQAVVAHFKTKTLAELEPQFLDLQGLADGWWSGRVSSGKSIELGTLTDANQATFPGIDGEGVWLAALFCTVNCNNPAPWSITVLEPCE